MSKYSNERKLKVVKYCIDEHHGYLDAANHFGIKGEQTVLKWVTDVTEFKLFGTKVYLSPIIDLFNGEVVSYNISDRPVFSQVMDMIDDAFDKILNNTNLILHSDQCWQYQMINIKQN